jgi:NAD(P)-dependent dehydrogenase (short-subunit alcohol dehydrogenase family)
MDCARTFTTDLKDHKIRVNAVSPGVIPSAGYRNAGMTEEQIKHYTDIVLGKIPLGRTGALDEVAKAVFLASDESSYGTGIELFVDGGMTQIRQLGRRRFDAVGEAPENRRP